MLSFFTNHLEEHLESHTRKSFFFSCSRWACGEGKSLRYGKKGKTAGKFQICGPGWGEMALNIKQITIRQQMKNSLRCFSARLPFSRVWTLRLVMMDETELFWLSRCLILFCWRSINPCGWGPLRNSRAIWINKKPGLWRGLLDGIDAVTNDERKTNHRKSSPRKLFIQSSTV